MPDLWNELEQSCMSCMNCPLGQTRTNVVFGVGNRNADVIFVGEGPGENEDIQGEPFVGKAGQLLDKYLYHVGLDRTDNIYIANIVKCRPPHNRDPLPEEQDCCIKWLRGQIRLMKPKIIVCLGRIAAQKIISPDFKVTKQHGEFYERKGMYLMGTYHPAALLRNPRQKPETLQDFVKLRDKIAQLCPDFEFSGE